ncbi:MAG: hypothetical protein ACRC9K_12165 [Afipia sp.]
MRVSLIIDGDASGAEKAAEATSRAVGDLGKESEAISKAIEAGFGRAIGSIEKLTEVNKKTTVANDNVTGSAMGVVGALTQVAGKALDTDSALSKIAAGSGAIVKGFSDIFKAAGTLGAITGAIGLAVAVGTTFYSVINSGSEQAKRNLDEQARLIGLVRDAYSGANKTAGDFYTTSRNIVLLQAQTNIAKLQADLQSKAAPFTATLAAPTPAPFGGEMSIGFDLANAEAAAKVDAFRGAVERLQSGLASGKPDFIAYQDEVSKIGLAAKDSNPAIYERSQALLKESESVGTLAGELRRSEAMLAVLNGTATEQQKKMLGISTATDQASNDYERLTKSLSRQAAAQEAEALTVGKSAGEAAKLRTQYLLNEAATQSGIKVTGEYAKEIDNLASRFGNAAQKAAEANLKSNAAFDLSQLGRTSIDSNVAGQLRQAYGDNVEAQMNGALATSIRFNESMRELKATTFELGSGAWRDIRTEIQAGTSALDAFGKAGLNAFNKIIDKAGDKALDALISKLFATFSGSGASGGILKLFGFSEGGWTGAGGKYEPAGIVHKEEVVWSQSDVSRHGGVAVVEAMRRGVPGYAGGGIVGGAPSPLSYMGASGGGAAQDAGRQRLQLEIGIYVDDDGKLGVIAREAGREGGREAADIRVTTFSKKELPDRVQQIQQNPRARG